MPGAIWDGGGGGGGVSGGGGVNRGFADQRHPVALLCKPMQMLYLFDCVPFSRIDYCDEQSDRYNDDISGPMGGIHMIDISIKNPDYPLLTNVV